MGSIGFGIFQDFLIFWIFLGFSRILWVVPGDSPRDIPGIFRIVWDFPGGPRISWGFSIFLYMHPIKDTPY